MEVFQRGHDLRGIKPRTVFGEAFTRSCLQCTKEFSTHAVFHAEIQITFWLKWVIKCYNERMVCCRKYLLLRQGALDFFPVNHFKLGEHCGSVESQLAFRATEGCGRRKNPLLPFIAYSLSLFFSLTRYTLPTSPLPSILILEKLDGPTSTLDG